MFTATSGNIGQLVRKTFALLIINTIYYLHQVPFTYSSVILCLVSWFNKSYKCSSVSSCNFVLAL